jgi:hypothetical protein
MKFSIKKFNGDDRYSWAVFRASDVRGMRSPIFSGQASPLVSGLSRQDASYHKSKLESSAGNASQMSDDERWYYHKSKVTRLAQLSDDEKRLKEIDQELLELKNARLLKLKSSRGGI